MPRDRGPSPDKIKDIADRAEGLKPAASETGRGRPPKYKPSFAGQASKLCALGATNADLADFFEVSIRTIERWTAEHEEFCRAVKEAKEAADDRVERSLYQRAVGYSFDSEKVFNNRGEIVRAKTREHCPPDVTAQIFWLKNRRKEVWRDRHELAGDPEQPLYAVIEQRIVDPKR
jgi:hypothetical protein